MPLNVTIGLLALFVALVLYTMGAIGAFRAKAFDKKRLTYIWIGLAADVLATIMMGISAGGLDLSPEGLPHTIVALVALFGMAGVGIAGWQALKSGNKPMLASLSKYVLAPWALWVFVFVWGMISRGAQRMG